MENLFTVLFLVFLEGLLSFDNALALAAMVKKLPYDQQRRALTYGMAGAFVFRIVALFCLTWILGYWWVKVLGGLWLAYLSVTHLVERASDGDPFPALTCNFWRVVLLIELTDIVFSVDSILAAAAMSQVFWVVVAGGIAGIVMMRFVSAIFVRLIDDFPRLEKSAFILVGIVGAKLLGDGLGFPMHEQFVTYGFWVMMALGLGYGFTERKRYVDVPL